MIHTRLATLVACGSLLFACGASPDATPGESNDPGTNPAADGGTNPVTNPGGDAGTTPGSDAGAIPEPPLDPFPNGAVTMAGAADSGDDDGVRGDARFNNPVNVLVTSDGSVLVADYDNGIVRRVDPEGRVGTLVRQPNFNRPFGLVITADGTLYVETDGNDMGGRSYETGTIWRVNMNSGEATPLVRDIGRPRGMAALPDGRIALSDPEHHTLSIFNPTTMEVTPLAGTTGQAGYMDGMGADARFDRPYDIVVRNGSLIVADQNNHRLRTVALDGTVTTLAGSGIAATTDGTGEAAAFNQPQGLAVDGAGNLYVSEMAGNVVRRVRTDGSVATVAGDGTSGYRDGDPLSARFFGLEGIDVSDDGALLFIADGNRGGMDSFHRVRRVVLDEEALTRR